MLVCHCHGVSDRRIREAVRQGARTPREVARSCGAGLSCGGCRPLVQMIVRTESACEASVIGEFPLSAAAGS